jgi:iron complex outermembrane receptor protein
VTSYKNVDQVRQYGVELIVEAKDVLIQGLDVDANLAWIDAKTIKNASNPAAEGVQFPRIPNGDPMARCAIASLTQSSWRWAGAMRRGPIRICLVSCVEMPLAFSLNI